MEIDLNIPVQRVVRWLTPAAFSIFVKNDGKIIFHSLIINIILLLINVMV
ncbi:hypothetical protein BN1221_00970c [Brenneria goodwinii]|uniref:Uncharacterized protein n=1 Tax=Brenneria goodwinii TaxID=1109412 RepID=A0A0G4JRL5_9GAMM|nr:hypothetical protein BN1221_00970c [Brenneria goodwinii]